MADPFRKSVKHICGEAARHLMIQGRRGAPIFILHMRQKWGVIIDLSWTWARSLTIQRRFVPGESAPRRNSQKTS